MKQKYVLIASAVGFLIFAVAYAATELGNTGVKNTGINMITTAAVERAGATIVETGQPSKPHSPRGEAAVESPSPTGRK